MRVDQAMLGKASHRQRERYFEEAKRPIDPVYRPRSNPRQTRRHFHKLKFSRVEITIYVNSRKQKFSCYAIVLVSEEVFSLRGMR